MASIAANRVPDTDPEPEREVGYVKYIASYRRIAGLVGETYVASRRRIWEGHKAGLLYSQSVYQDSHKAPTVAPMEL